MEELIRLQKTLQQILGDNSPTKVLANKGIILDLKGQSPIYEWSSPFAWYEKNGLASTARILSIGSPLANAIITKDFSYLDTFCKTLSMFDALKVDTISPLVSWYQSFQFTQHIFDLLQIPHTTREKFKEVEARYQQALFDCKWFPNAGEHVDMQIMDEILGIFKSSKPKSERCERRIDKVVFQYYTKSVIRSIKKNWYHSDLKNDYKKILGQAIEAHLRGEYALSVVCLATMWEGLIRFKTSMEGTRRGSDRTTKDFIQLVESNDLAPLFGKFYSELIVGQCDTENDVKPGIPNRNGVSHTKIKGYPNKKASLNAILLTDFIINMTTIDVMEETSNGTT